MCAFVRLAVKFARGLHHPSMFPDHCDTLKEWVIMVSKGCSFSMIDVLPSRDVAPQSMVIQ